MQLFHAYFHSKISYGIEMYSTAAKRHLKRIEILQHKALKTLFNLDPLTSSTSLHNKYKVLTIKDHYALNMAKIVHQYKMKVLPHIYENYFQELTDNNYPNTRNRMKLKLPRARIEQGKKMTKYQGACI